MEMSRAKGHLNYKPTILIEEDKQLICFECGFEAKSKAALSGHVGAKHRISMELYTIRHYFNNKRPKCEECGENTNYVKGQFEFKRYCKNHVHIARSKWSKENKTFDYGWKKGLAKDLHEGIARQAKAISGDNNWMSKNNRTKEKQDKINKATKKKIVNKRLSKIKLFNRFEKNKYLNFIGNYSDYTKNCDMNLKFECVQCKTKIVTSLVNFEAGRRCRQCFPFPNSSKDPKIREKISNSIKFSEEKIIELIQNNGNFKLISNYSDYKKAKLTKLDVKCLKCENQTKRTLQTIIKGTNCWKCNPRSHQEKEIADFIEKQGIFVFRNARNIISKELDIYIPSHKFAIEFNGLYWHSELQKPKDYHSSKTEECAKNNIQLFHIFEDEWRDKKEICKSMILHRLNKSPNRIHARNCEVKLLRRNKDYEQFFNRTHISGHSKSSLAFGLFYNNNLSACLSLRTPFHNKYKNSVEIARFAIELNTHIPGAFSKLYKYAKEWAKNNDKQSLITYADLRFGEGKVYESDFKYIHKTVLDFWYTDFENRHNRFKFRAQKGFTEKEWTELNDVHRIYGCGSFLFENKII